VGRQRTISRISLVPTDDAWLASLSRHWYLDWEGPRPENLAAAAAEAVRRDHEAAVQRRVDAGNGRSGPGPAGNEEGRVETGEVGQTGS
jgi:hypothetical protein